MLEIRKLQDYRLGRALRQIDVNLISHNQCSEFILEEGKTSLVLKILKSFLRMYIEALQDAALVVLDGKQCENDTRFSINLPLKSRFGKSKEEALMEKLGVRYELIKSIYVTRIMKFDRQFEDMHDKCEAFLNYLISKNEERHIYANLFVIKHMEGLRTSIRVL